MGRELQVDTRGSAAKPNEELERLESLAVQFGGAAHDVRSQLGAIRLTAQDALRRPEAAALREHLEEILACIDHANAVLDNTTAEAELGEEGEVDLVDLITARRAMLRCTAGRKVKLAFRFGSVPLVYGSPTSLVQAVTNLVKNAAEAIGDDGGQVTVAVRSEAGKVVLEVSDDGPGFSDEARERACETFFTTKPQGRGVGMALVRRVAMVHGAELFIESEDSRGAAVRMAFLPTS